MTKRKAPEQPAKVDIAKGTDAHEVPYVPPAPQPAEQSAGVFKQITTEADNQTHDFGLVAMAGIAIAVLGAIPWILIQGVAAQMYEPLHKFDPQGVGVAIGAICGGFGVALAALGTYRKLQGMP